MRSFGTGGLGRGSPKDADDANVVMISTRQYKGNKRFYRFSQDWALILDQEARHEVTKFARDNEAFLKAFGAVWEKVIHKGQSKVGVSALYAASA
jgi:catalase (peroxidase I)